MTAEDARVLALSSLRKEEELTEALIVIREAAKRGDLSVLLFVDGNATCADYVGRALTQRGYVVSTFEKSIGGFNATVSW